MRFVICVAAALLSTGTAAAQSNADAQGLDGIRAEIRQLRQDLRTLVWTAQRAQILVARVQVQDSTVKRAQERVDDAKSKLATIQDAQRQLNYELKRDEQLLEQQDDSTSVADAKRRKDLQDIIGRFKSELEQRAATEQETQSKLTEAEEQLRIQQAKLGGLQDDLDRLDKTLKESSQRPQ